METRNSSLHLQRVFYIQWQNEVEQQFSGTGGTCDHFFLNINILGKTAVLHLAHFCRWGCANSSLQFIGHNCTFSLLWFGAVPNSSLQCI
jgi:hypothetical protein